MSEGTNALNPSEGARLLTFKFPHATAMGMKTLCFLFSNRPVTWQELQKEYEQLKTAQMEAEYYVPNLGTNDIPMDTMFIADAERDILNSASRDLLLNVQKQNQEMTDVRENLEQANARIAELEAKCSESELEINSVKAANNELMKEKADLTGRLSFFEEREAQQKLDEIKDAEKPSGVPPELEPAEKQKEAVPANRDLAKEEPKGGLPADILKQIAKQNESKVSIPQPKEPAGNPEGGVTGVKTDEPKQG